MTHFLSITACIHTSWFSSKEWQYPLLALSVRCPQMVWGCTVWTEWTDTWICQRSVYVKFIPYTHMHTRMHTHILIPFEDCKPTGLKVDIAGFSSLFRFCRLQRPDLFVYIFLVTQFVGKGCWPCHSTGLILASLWLVKVSAHRQCSESSSAAHAPDSSWLLDGTVESTPD